MFGPTGSRKHQDPMHILVFYSLKSRGFQKLCCCMILMCTWSFGPLNMYGAFRTGVQSSRAGGFRRHEPLQHEFMASFLGRAGPSHSWEQRALPRPANVETAYIWEFGLVSLEVYSPSSLTEWPFQQIELSLALRYPRGNMKSTKRHPTL